MNLDLNFNMHRNISCIIFKQNLYMTDWMILGAVTVPVYWLTYLVIISCGGKVVVAVEWWPRIYP